MRSCSTTQPWGKGKQFQRREEQAIVVIVSGEERQTKCPGEQYSMSFSCEGLVPSRQRRPQLKCPRHTQQAFRRGRSSARKRNTPFPLLRIHLTPEGQGIPHVSDKRGQMESKPCHGSSTVVLQWFLEALHHLSGMARINTICLCL